MGSIAPVRRTNTRKASPPEEYNSSSKKQINGSILPLHHRINNSNADTDFSSVPRNTGGPKRIRRSRNKPVRCCGVPLDVPVIGVATIMFLVFLGVIFLVTGSTSSLHVPSDGDAVDRHQDNTFRHHFERQNDEHQRKLAPTTGRHHKDFEKDSPRPHPKNTPTSSSGRHHRKAAEEPGDRMILPSSPVRVVYETTEKDDIYDVVVAGAGPSGLTAALFASRAGLKVHVLGSPATGLLSQTKRLDNFPSFVGENSSTLTGPDWVETTLAQAKSWGANFGRPGMVAKSMERQRIALDGQDNDEEEARDAFFALATNDKTEPDIRAWSVIVASGATPRTLGLSGEDLLWGVSLHNCAICDGHIYQGTEKTPSAVLVVGGGDAALDAALLLARYATKVVLVHRRKEFTSAHNLASLDAVRSTPNIEILAPFVVNKWITKDDHPSQLVGAQLSSPGEVGNQKRDVDIDGAFVMIGASPNTKWMENVGIALDEEGLIQTTANLPKSTNPVSSHSMITASSVPGLFAAGEVTDNIYKQAITAAASGAQAAIDVERWLREQRGVSGSAKSVSGGSNHIGATPSSNQVKMEPVAVEVDEISDHGDNIQSDDGAAHRPENCDLVSEDCIRSIVEAYPVVVFSKPWCPYCRKALEALSLAGLSEESENLLVIDLSKHTDAQEIQSTLQTMTGRRTVPNVFVGGKSIGGGDETHSIQQTGKLALLLARAGAIGDANKHDPNNLALVPSSNSSSHFEKAEKRRNVQQDETVPATKKKPTVASGEAESCDLSSEDCIREIVRKFPVLLFSLSWCPECKASLEFLDGIGITKDQIHIIDLDDYKEIALDIRAHMKTLSGRRSVPNLFVGGEYIGGYRHTLEVHKTGELVEKFKEVGALLSRS